MLPMRRVDVAHLAESSREHQGSKNSVIHILSAARTFSFETLLRYLTLHMMEVM
jgi:hypothetical protein